MTAYEILISDWSSDVCSSDLLDAPVTIEDRSSRVLAFSGRQEPLAMFGRCARGGVGGGKWPGHRVARQAMFVVVRVITEFLGDDPGDAEVQRIGRAARRGSVCQYV